MKQFNLDEYLANPDRKVVTRDERPVRVICTDARDFHYPVVGLVLDRCGNERAVCYTKGGEFNCIDQSTLWDLFFVPTKHEGWVNIYKDGLLPIGNAVGIFGSEEEAKAAATDGCISTVKIEWKE